jgi:hypothetical protein
VADVCKSKIRLERASASLWSSVLLVERVNNLVIKI